jgi:hypothetical protein
VPSGVFLWLRDQKQITTGTQKYTEKSAQGNPCNLRKL